MGCVWSRADINDQHENIFIVANVDEEGRQVGRKGYLEITDSNLILHEKGKDELRWPLKSLRRFGAEQCIFSFESGRKCPTGEGIYAFHCKRAPRLLQALHDQLRLESTARGTSMGNGVALANVEQEMGMTAGTGETFLTDDSPELLQQPTLPPRRALIHEGSDNLNEEDIDDDEEHHMLLNVDNATAALLRSPIRLVPSEYANVDCTTGVMSIADEVVLDDGYLSPRNNDETCQDTNYQNVPKDNCDKEDTDDGSADPKPTSGTSTATTTGPLQYAMLAFGDSNTDTSTSSTATTTTSTITTTLTTATTSTTEPTATVTSPPAMTDALSVEELPGEYCTIDINRTRALTTTAQQQTTLRPHFTGLTSSSEETSTVAVGVNRLRGRLNSTLNELVNMKRQGVIGE